MPAARLCVEGDEGRRLSELLYQTDSYLRTCEGSVLHVDGERVELDRSVFYPTGGGQPHDLGWLADASARHAVVQVRRSEGRVWHHVPGHTLTPGTRVQCEIDWTRRHQLMRTHTTLHILSAIIWRDFAAPVTGGNMEPLRGRLDFEIERVPDDFVDRVQSAVNEEVAAARDVRVRILPRDVALEIPDLIRTKVNLLPPEIREIRTVEIVGLDLQADGGTHVANTREIGAARVVEYKSKGKMFKRVRVEVTDA